MLQCMWNTSHRIWHKESSLCSSTLAKTKYGTLIINSNIYLSRALQITKRSYIDTETLSPHPPILRWAQQTLATPFYRKRERLRRVHWLQIKWQKSVSGFRPGCDTTKMNNYTRALGRLSMEGPSGFAG